MTIEDSDDSYGHVLKYTGVFGGVQGLNILISLVKNKIGIGIAPRFFEDEENLRAIRISDSYTWDVYGIYLENSPDAQLAKRFLQTVCRLQKI